MARIRLLTVSLLALSLAACGGDDDSGGADGGPAFDAGPPDAPVATGYTARGVFSGAGALARDEHDDATLFELTSGSINGDGEVDPASNQSYWSYAFASLSTGVRVNVTFLQDNYSVSLGQVNPEGLKTLPADWMDSNEAIDAIAVAGYTVPSAGDTYTTVSMKLNMEPVLEGCDGPSWEIEKITAEPGQPVVSEHWFALYCTTSGLTFACDPGGTCTQL